MIKANNEERQTKVNLAKDGVRKRRNRKMKVNLFHFRLDSSILFFASYSYVRII